MSDLPEEDVPVVGEGSTASGALVDTPAGHGVTGSGVASYDAGFGATVSGVPRPPPEPPEDAATAPPVNVDIPYLGGTGAVGEVLACTMGNWEGMQAEPHSYAYAWASDGVPNSAIGGTYAVVPGDAGHSITCVVTATNAFGSTTAPPSNAIAIAGTARAQSHAPAHGHTTPTRGR